MRQSDVHSALTRNRGRTRCRPTRRQFSKPVPRNARGNHNNYRESNMPKKRKKTWLSPSNRNHPEHTQEIINLVDAMARWLSGGTWPDEIRERKTAWRRAYEFYTELLVGFPDQHTDTPQPTANSLLVYQADMKHYRRPYPIYAPHGHECKGGHLKSSMFTGGRSTFCTCLATGDQVDCVTAGKTL